MMKRIMAAGVCILFLAVAGCGGGYYKVTDPGSGKTYYTNSVKRHGDGRIEFKDKKSGSEVTLQSSEVQEVDKKEFNEATKK